MLHVLVHVDAGVVVVVVDASVVVVRGNNRKHETARVTVFKPLLKLG